MRKAGDFIFKQFKVSQQKSTHKVGTDGVLLGAWVRLEQAKTILDVGTGTGVIALMLAQRSMTAVTDALEIQQDDANQAKENFLSSPWPSRLRAIHQSLQQFSPAIKYDLIVSNPPYFQNSYLPPSENRTIVRHTGALPFDDLLAHSVRLLSDLGRCAFIRPPVEGDKVIAAARQHGLFLSRMCEFRSRATKPVERVLMEFGFAEKAISTESLVLYAHERGEEWSEDYKAITKDFYLRI